MGEAIVFTSGKGGVGKTTCLANIGAELSLLDKKVIMIDADMGLRNLDVVMGYENLIVYNLKDLFERKCRLQQVFIRDHRYPNLYMIPASEEPFAFHAYEEQMTRLIQTLKQECDYLLIDCPAGIDQGFWFAVSSVDRAVIVTTPHVFSIKDAGKVTELLSSNRFLQMNLLINQVNQKLLKRKDMLSSSDVEEILDLPVLGVVPNNHRIVVSQNYGVPVGMIHKKSARPFRIIAKRVLTSRIIPVDLAEESKSTFLSTKWKKREVPYEIS